MLAIIPARGGSKGLHKKNILKLGDKPLIAHTIEAALNSPAISRVVVSTDCEEIANIASTCGADVPFLRPESLALDDSPAIDTYIYTVNRLDKEAVSESKTKEFAVLLPTSPLRNSADIDSAVSMFYSKNADSVISFTKESHPITWHKYLAEDHRLESIFPEDLRNRQEIRPTYYPNGAIYIFRFKLLKEGSYYSKNSYAYIMPPDRSVDIDNQIDLDFAKFLLERTYVS